MHYFYFFNVGFVYRLNISEDNFLTGFVEVAADAVIDYLVPHLLLWTRALPH